MLTLFSQPRQTRNRFCDGLQRRDFLKIGGFAFGGVANLGLPQILSASSASGNAHSQKSVIHVFLGGGPPHQDMWEIKTEAPSEFRGEFAPISTAVPGIQIGEVFEGIAARMDKCVAIRSVVGNTGAHDAHQCLTGYDRRSLTSIGGRPSIGSVLAKLQGSMSPSIPPSVALADKTRHEPWSEPGPSGYLGPAYQAFRPNGQGMDDLTLNNITLERLQDRKELLRGLDTLKKSADVGGMLDGVDAFTEAAFGVLTSSQLADALDLSKEDPKVRARYGDGKPYNYQYDGAPTCNDHLLMARRLVEAGVRSVTLSYGRWDSHSKNFDLVRDHGGKLDQGLSALIDDLEERGRLDDTTIVVWGEFGRTPRVNQNAGRDHWPRVSCCLLIGGGMQTGQAIGATNRLGEHPAERPVDVQEILCTIYHNLGIDVMNTTIPDPTGRPQYLLDIRQPMRELV